MKIALLGFGKEGQAAKTYFEKHGEQDFRVFENFTPEEIALEDFSGFDLVLRSPSVPPLGFETSSVTKYFFEHCPCPIIGVTGTKGKGTTCSLIRSLLEALGRKVYLVGNIGVPAIEILDELTPDAVVVYEMSSFQLWDLKQSPHVAVVLPIESDHLNVHRDFDEYVEAKANLVRFQEATDFCIYNSENAETRRVADISDAEKIAYPEAKFDAVIYDDIAIPGKHNRENAEAALKAVAAHLGTTAEELIKEESEAVAKGLSDFKGLPHRLEFLRELNGVSYYDDNFSTNPASTKVAIEAFPEKNIVLILGGRDKTGGEDFPEIHKLLLASNVRKIVLMGESGHALKQKYSDLGHAVVVESLEEAVSQARKVAEGMDDAIVLMSPAAASFDMFQNVYDRGDQFRNLILSLD